MGVSGSTTNRGFRATARAYTGRFFRKGASEVGCVILSAAKDLSPGQAQILRCAQDDSLWRPARFKKPTRVRACPRPGDSFLHIRFIGKSEQSFKKGRKRVS